MKSTKKSQAAAPPLLHLEGLLWVAGLIVAWWWTLAATGTTLRFPIYFSAALSIAAGVRGFVGHGRSLVTATGLFSLSASIFIGYSGFLLLQNSRMEPFLQYVALAVAAGLTAQVITTMLAWKDGGGAARTAPSYNRASSVWMVRAGLLGLVLATALLVAMPDWHSLAEASAFTAICILSAGLVFRADARILSWSSVWVAGGLILYAEFFHSGAGRLRLVALACSLAVIYGLRFQRRSLKFFVIALLPLALIWLANDRLALQESLAAGASEGRTGLESMVAPLEVLSLLLHSFHEQGFTPAYGYNLLSVPAMAIPETLWASQPQALGYELVMLVDPAKYGDGQFSTVASWVGEGIFNFGWWGLPVVIVFASVVLRFLDSLLQVRLSGDYTPLIRMLGVVLVAMLIGAIADYTWSGVHTYSARMLSRLPLFFIVFSMAWFHSQLGRTRQIKTEAACSSRSKIVPNKTQ